jgi:hypothetical protein
MKCEVERAASRSCHCGPAAPIRRTIDLLDRISVAYNTCELKFMPMLSDSTAQPNPDRPPSSTGWTVNMMVAVFSLLDG